MAQYIPCVNLSDAEGHVGDEPAAEGPMLDKDQEEAQRASTRATAPDNHKQPVAKNRPRQLERRDCGGRAMNKTGRQQQLTLWASSVILLTLLVYGDHTTPAGRRPLVIRPRRLRPRRLRSSEVWHTSRTCPSTSAWHLVADQRKARSTRKSPLRNSRKPWRSSQSDWNPWNRQGWRLRRLLGLE